MNISNNPCVRAIDVGHGHVKFTTGRSSSLGAIQSDIFPSLAPAHSHHERRSCSDTFIVPQERFHYVVGKGVANAMDPNFVPEVLDDGFCRSEAYAARIYGALNYMRAGLNGNTIDCLVLGLPVALYEKRKDELVARFTGSHSINLHDETIDVRRTVVYPQPLGSYASYLSATAPASTPSTVLVIDVGYNNVNWMTYAGMQVDSSRSGTVRRGLYALLRPVAEHVIRSLDCDADTGTVIRRIDTALARETDFTMFGRPIDLSKYLPVGDSVIADSVQAITNSVGTARNIDAIVVSGGGAKLYAPAIQRSYPERKVVLLTQPAEANVRGLHAMGERLARMGSEKSDKA